MIAMRVICAPPRFVKEKVMSEGVLWDKIKSLETENEALRQDAERYQIARKMNPLQWADAYQLNIQTGKPFDEIIDAMEQSK